ncbi:MAG: S41 family peptidase [Treponemataceae bacterium]
MNEPQKSPRKRLPILPILWIVSTIALCSVFSVAAAPRAEAESAEDGRRYALIIQNVFDFIQRHYVDEVQAQKLYEGAMKGMFEALGDPHSVFLPASDMADLNDTTQGSFGGVGLYITKPTAPTKTGAPTFVEVASPIEDTPGWRAGISPGDLILEIDGKSTEKLTMDEVLARLRGKPGTEVSILIRRGEKLEFTVKLTRAIIEVPTVKSAMIGADIGYVKIITFTPMTAERVGAALDTFQKSGYKSLIVDLRFNYGGLLQAAIGVSDYFLEGGLVVSTKSRIPNENSVFTAKNRPTVPKDIPVVVLINRGSASASEIVAGALKDRGRAYLIGEKSFGKGSVQQVYPIDDAGFKITTSRYYTPSDVNIDKIGIPPDLEVKFPELSNDEAETLNKLIADEKIPLFVKTNPKVEAAKVDVFVKQLLSSYKINEPLLRRMVRDEQNRTLVAPVYDLEYDVQLKAAINVVRGGKFFDLMKSVKNLKTLQEEAAKTESVTDKPTVSKSK